MASLQRRRDGRVEIRETLATGKGPRSRTLVVFRGSLTPDLLERAAARAERPFDPDSLVARARSLGIRVSARREDRDARAFLSALRRGADVDPGLLHAIREALARAAVSSVPAPLEEVAEWLGAGAHERGRALRGLLRTYDRIAKSRPTPRRRDESRFPVFASRSDPEPA